MAKKQRDLDSVLKSLVLNTNRQATKKLLRKILRHKKEAYDMIVEDDKFIS